MAGEGWIFLFVLVWVGLATGQYDTFYLLPSGSDTTNCTTSITPCASLEYVMNFVTPNSTIFLYGGDYYINDLISLNESITVQGEVGGLDPVNIICASSNASISIDGPTTVEGFTLRQCTGFAMSLALAASNVTISNITFTENEVALFIAFVSSITITDVLVFNNSNNYGTPSVQILSSDDIHISNSRFIGNSNTLFNRYSEGTLSMLATTNVHIEDCYFEGNTQAGAAFYMYAGSGEVINSEFRNNTGLRNGSSISVGASKVNITNCIITGGNATNGGAIYVQVSATVNINNATIENNIARLGGGVFMDNKSTCNIQDSTIANNSATAMGGGIYSRLTVLNITGTNILENGAQNGGGLAIINCTGYVLSSTIVGNSADAFGGGFYMDSSYFISGSTISGNTISSTGENSGIYFASNQTITGLRVVSTAISNDSPYEFCCTSPQFVFNVITGTMVETICNYPACNPATCPGATAGTCLCPTTIAPIVCNCTVGLTGPFCTIVDQCANSSFCDSHTNCSRIAYDEFACSACPKGFNGTGETGCVDFDECTQVPNICASDLNCFNLPGSYQCSVCPPGFTGNGVSCVDVNECLTNNGGCDYHTQCTNTNGSFTCGGCPQGFEGNGYIGCVAQCGNGVCEPGLGEDCVSCHTDCRNSSCQRCGDNYCDASIGENCTSCYQDCGLCAVKKCGGTPTCSGHGDCREGVCVCNGTWSGPICNQDNTAINVSFPTGNNSTNGTDPGIHITPSTKGDQNLTFSLTLSSIIEMDNTGEQVYSLDLGDRNYTSYLVSENDTLDSVAVVTSASGSAVKQYVMNTTLENKAYLEIMIWLFSDTATVEFANTSTQYLANTIKISVRISGWPFRSLQNTIGVVLDSAVQTPNRDACEGIESNTDETGSLQWVTINIDGVTMYGQFLQKAIVDDEVRFVSFKLNSDGKSVVAKIPYFWQYAVIDPSYSVLLGETSEGCKSKNSHTMVIVVIAVVVPILGIALIAAVGGVIYRRVHLKWHIRESQKPSPKKKKPISMEMAGLPENASFERVTEMKTNTAVGTFTVQL